MTPHATLTAPATGHARIQWICQRDTRAVTCQLNLRGRESYEVCVLPHWNPSLATIEHFESATPALVRHAQLACRLREAGLVVIDHVVARYVRGA